MEESMQFSCWVCGKPVVSNGEDSYALQVTKKRTTSPEMQRVTGLVSERRSRLSVWKYQRRVSRTSSFERGAVLGRSSAH
jgi:hypothetical protein